MVAGAPALAASAIAQTYQTTSAHIVSGTLLSLVPGSQTSVQPASTAAGSGAIVGVAAASPLIAFGSGSQQGIQVAVGGTADVLVSDINGTIEAGDVITASPITGVGMKATQAGTAVGTAQGHVNSSGTFTQELTDKSGKHRTVHIGLVPIAVGVQYFGGSAAGQLSAYIPAVLQNLANAISGKAVSPLKILLSLVIMLLGFGTVVAMVTTAVKSGIISIGRNPLAAGALRRGLVDVALVAIGILLIVSAASYGIITG